MTRLRSVPSVEKVLHALGDAGLPRGLVLEVVRQVLAQCRQGTRALAFEDVLAEVRTHLLEWRRSRLQSVINGTGVLVHTNLGRAPMSEAVAAALARAATEYSSLEYDLATGERGPRARYLEGCLALLCGAEAATVVNNCAAALVLILRHFVSSARPEVVLSRGELVQIGGGFRIPEVLEASGARLREVGTTNQTTVDDYARAIGPHTALLLRVHRSNFYMDGFVHSPPLRELAALARSRRLPFVEDLGSGALMRTEQWAGLTHEPMPAEVLGGCADLVCFSGDKLLGGPQAGIIAGKARRIAALKREPFFRAVRCDKLVLTALQCTVDEYLNGPGPSRASARLPLVEMLTTSPATLRARAEALIKALHALPVTATVGAGKAQIGGGTLPRAVLASITLDLAPDRLSAAELSRRLRLGSPPVVGYVNGRRLKLDLRTVFPRQDAALVATLTTALAEAE